VFHITLNPDGTVTVTFESWPPPPSQSPRLSCR